MATQETVNKLVTLIDEVVGHEVDDIVRNPMWGEYNFDECWDDLERAFSVLRPLSELPLESLLQKTVQNIEAHLTSLRDAINNTIGFSIKQDAPEHERTRLASDLASRAQATWELIAPWLGYLMFQAGDVSESLNKITASRGHVDDALVKFLKAADIGTGQIMSAVTAAKDIAGKAGVGHFTEDFASEAEDFKEVANRWLWATGVLAGATGIAAFLLWFLFDAPYFVDVPSLIQLTTMKLIILGLLFTATIWSGRMYKTAKHQETVNKHRANALKTFQAFVEAAIEDSTRDAILMETTRSIFAITPSGFLGDAEKAPDSGSKIIEIVKAASKAAKPETE